MVGRYSSGTYTLQNITTQGEINTNSRHGTQNQATFGLRITTQPQNNKVKSEDTNLMKLLLVTRKERKRLTSSAPLI